MAKEAQILLQALVEVEAGLPCLALGVAEDRWKTAKEEVVAG